MKPLYKAIIRENSTGEIVEWEDQYSKEGEAFDRDLFWWTDGNFGCDCNRSLAFYRGVHPEAKELPDGFDDSCGHKRFSIQLIRLDTGETFYDEFTENQG